MDPQAAQAAFAANQNPVAGPPPQTPSLSDTQIAQIIQILQQKTSIGRTQENDPEFAHLAEMLRTASIQRQFLRQQHLLMQQQQQQALASNGTPGTQQPAPLVAPGMTEANVQQLSAQVHAFRYMGRNLPVPEHLHGAIQGDPAASDPRAASGNPPVHAVAGQLALAQGPPKAAVQQQQGPLLKADDPLMIIDPWALVTRAATAAGQRLLVPSVMPRGMDVVAIQDEMDRRIASRVLNRIRELESILASTLPETGSGVGSEESANLKLRALVELKSLKLLDKQQRLRDEVIHGLRRSSILYTAPDRNAFKRVRIHSARDPRITESLERASKAEREKKEKHRHSVFISTVIAHGTKLKAYHAKQQERWTRVGRSVQGMFARIEKEEKERKQRLAQERLRALRAGDEDAYMRLIDQAKDTRITHLLKQTDAFLESLVHRVEKQKQTILSTRIDAHAMKAAVTEAKTELDDKAAEELGEDHVIDTSDGRKLDYYAVIHRNQERVERQASIMVGGTLKEYQVRGLQWMVSLYNNNMNGILADEMGLGKTVQTISLITYLIEKKRQNGPYLVIVPLSTMSNWQSEFERWAPSVSVIGFKGNPTQRKAQAAMIKGSRWNVVLTTYEYVIREKLILSRIKWLYVIIDEGHRMKNNESVLSRTLCEQYSFRYRMILTGTPLQNNLPELWALLNFILPDVFNSQSSFDEWFSAPFADVGSAEDRISLNEEEALLVIKRLHKILRPFLLRRLKKDVEKDLPDKVEKVVKTRMSALQRVLYDQVRKHGAIAAAFEETGRKRQPGTKGLNNQVMQLKKVCNHPYLYLPVELAVEGQEAADVTDLIWRTSGKFELLDRILPKLFRSGHRVLMFFQMTEVMKIMEDYFKYRGYKYLSLSGDTKHEDRQEQLRHFNAPDSEILIFILSTRAGGLGLNLQTADTVIIFDSDWNPHQDLQAQDRAHRIGQTKEVRILRLITENSVEERILARAQHKLDMDGKVIQAGKFDQQASEKERDEFLRALIARDDENDGKSGDGACDEDGDDLNEMLARSEEEMVLFRQMDVELAQSSVGYLSNYPRKGGVARDRLITDGELPPMVTRDVGQMLAAQHDAEQIVAGSRRSRRVATYADDRTDAQFVAEMEAMADAVETPKRGRRAKQAAAAALELDHHPSATPASGAGGAGGAGGAAGGAAAAAGTTRKRGRQRMTGVEDEGDADANPMPAKRSKKGIQGPDLTGAAPEVLHAYATVQQALLIVDGLEDPADGHLRSGLFQELPERDTYPQYYLQIARPISLAEIRAKIADGAYGVDNASAIVAHFAADLKLMCDNARQFNLEGSVVYTDAEMLEASVMPLLSGDVSAAPVLQESPSGEDQQKQQRQQQHQQEWSNGSSAAAAAAAAVVSPFLGDEDDADSWDGSGSDF